LLFRFRLLCLDRFIRCVEYVVQVPLHPKISQPPLQLHSPPDFRIDCLRAQLICRIMQRGQIREAISSWLKPIRQILSNSRAQSNASITRYPSNQTPETLCPSIASASDTYTGKRLSCWAQAYKNLETEDPQLSTRIQLHDEDDQKDPERLLETVRKSRKPHEPLPRWLEQSIRSVLQFKELFSAAASLDPLKCAPIVVKGTMLILQVGPLSLVLEKREKKFIH
jgi:hypothetical protein